MIKPTANKQPTSQKNILIVDDEENLLVLLDRILTRQGYQVVTAQNSHDACTLLLTQVFQLAILDFADLVLEVLDGGGDGGKLVVLASLKLLHLVLGDLGTLGLGIVLQPFALHLDLFALELGGVDPGLRLDLPYAGAHRQEVYRDVGLGHMPVIERESVAHAPPCALDAIAEDAVDLKAIAEGGRAYRPDKGSRRRRDQGVAR